jgi:hypothetical protein
MTRLQLRRRRVRAARLVSLILRRFLRQLTLVGPRCPWTRVLPSAPSCLRLRLAPLCLTSSRRRPPLLRALGCRVARSSSCSSTLCSTTQRAVTLSPARARSSLTGSPTAASCARRGWCCRSTLSTTCWQTSTLSALAGLRPSRSLKAFLRLALRCHSPWCARQRHAALRWASRRALRRALRGAWLLLAKAPFVVPRQSVVRTRALAEAAAAAAAATVSAPVVAPAMVGPPSPSPPLPLPPPPPPPLLRAPLPPRCLVAPLPSRSVSTVPSAPSFFRAATCSSPATSPSAPCAMFPTRSWALTFSTASRARFLLPPPHPRP